MVYPDPARCSIQSAVEGWLVRSNLALLSIRKIRELLPLYWFVVVEQDGVGV